MKTKVDIVSGLLDSGKTTFINGMLENRELSGERIVIIQCEHGETEIDNELVKDKTVYIKKLEKENTVDSEYIDAILNEYSPDRIIIEYNGMASLESLFAIFEGRQVRKKSLLDKVVNTIDASTFEIFINNMGAILTGQISECDLIILNKTDSLSKEKLDNIERTLKTINKSAVIARAVIYDESGKKAVSDEGKTGADYPNKKKKRTDILMALFFIFIGGYLLFSILRSADLSSMNIDLSWLKALNMVFLSILMQAFPFILIGVFISSILQVFIPGEALVKFFPRKMGLGFIAAMLAGFLFPVCDCAVVPVAARLVKKGVPLSCAITFMLSAPLVNPIVIASTLYAFPGQPQIAFYRVYFGITVAFAVGMTLQMFPEKNSILKGDIRNLSCSCGYCGENYGLQKGIGQKVNSIFKHAGSEFFEVAKFLVIGAFLSSIMQTLVPKDIFNSLRGQNALSLLIMMAAAFVFSVCSTSDAFIGRTFINQFSIGSIMGFLVLGPMIDVKNMLMLLSSFKKSFVIKLVAIIFGFAFAILLFLTALFL